MGAAAHEVRAAIPTFYAIHPNQVPVGAAGYGDLPPTAYTELRGACLAFGRLPVSSPLDECWISAALQALPTWQQDESPRVAPAVDKAIVESHDIYFRIARSSEPVGPAYVRGILMALRLFHTEARTLEAAGLAGYGVIRHALIGALCAYLRVPVARRKTPFTPAPMDHRAEHPVRRWIIGHQIFAIVTQGLIWALQTFESAEAAGDASESEAALAMLAELFEASAAAFRFAADFAPIHYERVIRPSMSAPWVPEGFSGALSADHGQLIAVLSRLREPMTAARTRHAESHAAMSTALSHVYEDHKFVCARFDGSHLPSLRMQKQDVAPSGVEMLDRFKQRRMRMVSP